MLLNCLVNCVQGHSVHLYLFPCMDFYFGLQWVLMCSQWCSLTWHYTCTPLPPIFLYTGCHFLVLLWMHHEMLRIQICRHQHRVLKISLFSTLCWGGRMTPSSALSLFWRLAWQIFQHLAVAQFILKLDSLVELLLLSWVTQVHWLTLHPWQAYDVPNYQLKSADSAHLHLLNWPQI